MRTTSALFLALGLAMVGCSAPAQDNQQQQPDPVGPVTMDPVRAPGELFGDELDSTLPVVSYNDLARDPAAHSGEYIETSAIVRASCQVRGCWMEIRSMDDVSSPGMTVRFKNYGFFVPLDARGAEVRIQGKVSVQQLTAEQVAHTEEEGGTFDKKNPDGSAEVITFIAFGVEMWRTE